ncbi:MAG: glycosyltransferase family 39 protein, partial [Bryobacteraceae bacterium]
MYAGRHYGYFIDELYYLACSRHLAWGYVDQPPLIAWITWLVRSVLGESLPAIRFFPAVAGACEVALAAFIARELGGKRFAQGLAALATLAAPGILAMDNLLTMNAFEPLFWMGCAWLLIRIVKTGNRRLWIWFGILAGFGLENKYSMLIFGAGVALGLLLTPQRRLLASPWLWIAGALAVLLFLPNLLWNIQHHFPFLELQANIRHSGRDVRLTVFQFFGQEILTMHPLTLPLWLAGLWYYFFSALGKPFRALGWVWVFTATVIVTLSPRIYYLYTAF